MTRPRGAAARLRAAAAALIVLVPARAFAADATATTSAERVRASLGSRMGLAQTPFPSSTAHEISGLLTSLLMQGEGWATPAVAVRLRVPLVLAGVDQPAGAARAETAWGNPEAAVLWRARETPATRLLGRLALAVPLPGGDAALGRNPLDNQALMLASAQRGYHDHEIYAPGRLALTPAARIDVSGEQIAAWGEVKLPFMFAIVRGDSEPQTSVRDVAVSTMATAGASVAWRRLRAGAAAWLTVDLLPAATIRGDPPPRWTLTIDPDASVRIDEHLAASVTATIPLAGALSPAPAIELALTGAW